MQLRILMCGILVVAASPLGAGGRDRLSMRVSPVVAIAPVNLVVQATIEVDNQNRAIEIIAESSDFYRSSQMPLEGDKAPRKARFEFRGLPGGEYTVMAVLKGVNDEPLAQTRRVIKVVPSPSAR